MDKYTKFILTVIAVALIGILFKGEIITSAEASWGLPSANTLRNFVKVTEYGLADIASVDEFNNKTIQ